MGNCSESHQRRGKNIASNKDIEALVWETSGQRGDIVLVATAMGGAIKREAARDNRLLPSDQLERRREQFLQMSKSGRNCRKRLKKGFHPTVYHPGPGYR